MIYFTPRYKKCDRELKPYQKVFVLMNATLLFWFKFSKTPDYVNDAKDVAGYADVGENNALDIFDSRVTEVLPSAQIGERNRKTWAPSSRNNSMLSSCESVNENTPPGPSSRKTWAPATKNKITRFSEAPF